jgi:hypothetical protein
MTATKSAQGSPRRFPRVRCCPFYLSHSGGMKTHGSRVSYSARSSILAPSCLVAAQELDVRVHHRNDAPGLCFSTSAPIIAVASAAAWFTSCAAGTPINQAWNKSRRGRHTARDGGWRGEGRPVSSRDRPGRNDLVQRGKAVVGVEPHVRHLVPGAKAEVIRPDPVVCAAAAPK